ncbi:MAG: YkgJ family cysteine cluster protein [Gemmataceae bacterium]|nr:YkgJ family cysteine cluster protein [Gemmataceae bacterium]
MCRTLAGATDVDYDCQRCGACCLSITPSAGYVVLERDEATQLRRLSLPIVIGTDGQSFLATEPYDGPGGAAACIAFEGAPGFPSRCLIYAARPTKCREFEAGSIACRTARLRAGLPIG